MANNHSVTSVTLRAKSGDPAVFGVLGTALIEMTLSYGDNWFQIEKGVGTFEYMPETTDVIEAIAEVHEDVNWEVVSTLHEALQAIKAKDDSLVSEGMLAATIGLERAAEVDFFTLIEICRCETGADIEEACVEAGFWCDKNRYDEFGGHGYYWSPAVTVGVYSHDAQQTGQSIKAALEADNLAEVAAIIMRRNVAPLVNSMPEALRQLIYLELGKAMGVSSHDKA